MLANYIIWFKKWIYGRTGFSFFKDNNVRHSVHLWELFTVKRRHQLPGSGLGGDEVFGQGHGRVTANIPERGGEKCTFRFVFKKRGRADKDREDPEMEREKKKEKPPSSPDNHFVTLLKSQALHSEQHSLQRARQRVGEGDLGWHLFTNHGFS